MLKKNLKTAKLIVLLLTSFIIGGIVQAIIVSPLSHYEERTELKEEIKEKPTGQVKTSDFESNAELIEQSLIRKLENCTNLGYFPQIYESSLQAIYYAVYTLKAIGQEASINTTFITESVMSYYNETTGIFIDKYALRYLDSDADQLIYPYSTLLQVNCYAILTLALLNEIDVIDTAHFIGFIWSCFNYDYGGFIGQPHSAELESYFKVPALDTHYFAMLTLDTLGVNWMDYPSEKNLIVQFIDSLQEKEQGYPTFGGFYNDPSLYSVETTKLIEPNMHTSYYALKSLDIIGSIDTIDLNSFTTYFSSLYREEGGYFVSSNYEHSRNFTNIVATAMGLELNEIIGWDGVNETKAFSFLRSNRNDRGLWKTSSDYQAYELIDTYQVVRSLNNTNLLPNLTAQELDETIMGLELFEQYDGYSLFSKEYNTIDQMYSIIETWNFFERIHAIDIGTLYTQISEAYKEGEYFETFYHLTHPQEPIRNFRTYPIEFFSSGKHELSGETGRVYGHKATFKALASMLYMFKLDDFQIRHDLSRILEKIIASQFLDPNYENYGGFMPNALSTDPKFQNSLVFLEHSYYAVKSMEFLADYLNVGNVSSLSFNKMAFYDYLTRFIEETDTTIYCDPGLPNSSDKTLEYTYYMVYLLTILDFYDLDTLKLENFIEETIDYTTIKDVYYAYKLSNLLNHTITLDYQRVRTLVQELYIEELNEFYVSNTSKTINQDALLWISEMAMNSDIKIYNEYEKFTPLGSVNTITTTFDNLVLEDFDQYLTVKFESNQLGDFLMERIESNKFQVSFRIPDESSNFPAVEGKVKVYHGSKVLAQSSISISTEVIRVITYEISESNESVYIECNASRKFPGEYKPLEDSRMSADIYINETYFQSRNFTQTQNHNHTYFSLDYTNNLTGTYSFETTLEDSSYKENVSVFSYTAKEFTGTNSLLPDPEIPQEEAEIPQEDPEEEEDDEEENDSPLDRDWPWEDGEDDEEEEEEEESPWKDSVSGLAEIIAKIITLIIGIVLIVGIIYVIYRVVRWLRKRKKKNEGDGHISNQFYFLTGGYPMSPMNQSPPTNDLDKRDLVRNDWK